MHVMINIFTVRQFNFRNVHYGEQVYVSSFYAYYIHKYLKKTLSLLCSRQKWFSIR